MALVLAATLREEWPPRGGWTVLYVMLLALGFVVGLLLTAMSFGLWMYSRGAWWVSIVVVGMLMRVAMMLGLQPVLLYLGAIGILLLIGWSAAHLAEPGDRRQ